MCYRLHTDSLRKFCSVCLFPGLKSTSTIKLLVIICQLVTNDCPCVSGSVAEWSKAQV